MTGQIILEEIYDHDYEFSESEIRDYAQWLGIDPETEPELLYLAQEGIRSQLPAYWRPCQDKNGDIYYFNFSTGQSVWEHPCDLIYKALVHTERARLKRIKTDQPCCLTNPNNEQNSVKPELCRKCNENLANEQYLGNAVPVETRTLKQQYVEKSTPIDLFVPNVDSTTTHQIQTKHAKSNFEAKLFSNYPKHVDTNNGIKPKFSLAGPRMQQSRSSSLKFRRRESISRAKRFRRSSSTEMESRTSGDSNMSLNMVNKVDQRLLNGFGSTDLSTNVQDDNALLCNQPPIHKQSNKRTHSNERLSGTEIDEHFEDQMKLIDPDQHEYGIPLVCLNQRYPEADTCKHLGKPKLIHNPDRLRNDVVYDRPMVSDRNQALVRQPDMPYEPLKNYTSNAVKPNHVRIRTRSPSENIRIIALRNYLNSVESGCLTRVPSIKSSEYFLQRERSILKQDKMQERSLSYDDIGKQHGHFIRPFVVDLRQRHQIRSKSWSPIRYGHKRDDKQGEQSPLGRNLSCPRIISPTLNPNDFETQGQKPDLNRFVLESIARQITHPTYCSILGQYRTNSCGPIGTGHEKNWLSSKSACGTNRSLTSRSFKNAPFSSNFGNQSIKESLNPEIKHTIDWDRMSIKLGQLRNSVFERLLSERKGSVQKINGLVNPELAGYLEWLDSARSKLRQMDAMN